MKSETLTIKKNEKICLVADNFDYSQITLNYNSRLYFVQILKKGLKKPKIINIHLNGEKAELIYLLIIIGNNKEIFPLEIAVHHNEGNNKAKIIAKSVLNDISEVDFKGGILIGEKAKNCDSHLSHHSLLLSKNASVKTIPFLEIKNDEVKAGHSASTGKIDEDALFYLQSRGISLKKAGKILTESFLKEDIVKIPDKACRKKILNNFLHA